MPRKRFALPGDKPFAAEARPADATEVRTMRARAGEQTECFRDRVDAVVVRIAAKMKDADPDMIIRVRIHYAPGSDWRRCRIVAEGVKPKGR